MIKRALMSVIILAVLAHVVSTTSGRSSTEAFASQAPSFVPGTGFDRVHSDLTPATAQSFSSFTLYWLGEEFEGFRLTNIGRRLSKPLPEERRGADYVSFIYGSCNPSSHGGCAAPLEIQVWPACVRTLQDYTLTPRGEPLPHSERHIRGVPAALFPKEGRLELYSGEVTVVIFGHNEDVVFHAADALRGANVAVLQSEDLPSPSVGALSGSLECEHAA